MKKCVELMAAYGYIQPSNIFSALLIVSQILHLLHAIFYGIKKKTTAHTLALQCLIHPTAPQQKTNPFGSLHLIKLEPQSWYPVVFRFEILNQKSIICKLINFLVVWTLQCEKDFAHEKWKYEKNLKNKLLQQKSRVHWLLKCQIRPQNFYQCLIPPKSL